MVIFYLIFLRQKCSQKICQNFWLRCTIISLLENLPMYVHCHKQLWNMSISIFSRTYVSNNTEQKRSSLSWERSGCSLSNSGCQTSSNNNMVASRKTGTCREYIIFYLIQKCFDIPLILLCINLVSNCRFGAILIVLQHQTAISRFLHIDLYHQRWTREVNWFVGQEMLDCQTQRLKIPGDLKYIVSYHNISIPHIEM